MDKKKEEGVMDLTPLMDVVRTLRSPGGCPWDQAQDHKSMRRELVEEVYELLEAIDVLPVKTFLRALLASLLMGGAVLWVNRTLLVKLGLVTSTLGAVGAGALFYGLLLLVLREVPFHVLKKKRRHHG